MEMQVRHCWHHTIDISKNILVKRKVIECKSSKTFKTRKSTHLMSVFCVERMGEGQNNWKGGQFFCFLQKSQKSCKKWSKYFNQDEKKAHKTTSHNQKNPSSFV